MKINDIIALAKSGYKVSEIKELMALGEQQQSEEPAEIPAREPAQPEPENAGPEPAGEPAPDPNADKIKALEDEIRTLRSDLAKAQKNNTKQDLSGADKMAGQQSVDDIMRGLL